MVPVDQINQYDNSYNEDTMDDVISLYKETIDKIKPSVYESVFKCDWTSGDRIMLQHRRIKNQWLICILLLNAFKIFKIYIS